MTNLNINDIATIASTFNVTRAMIPLSISTLILLPLLLAFSGGVALRFMQYMQVLLENEYERVNPTPKNVIKPLKVTEVMYPVNRFEHPKTKVEVVDYSNELVKQAEADEAKSMAIINDRVDYNNQSWSERMADSYGCAGPELLPYCDDEDVVLVISDSFTGQMLPA